MVYSEDLYPPPPNIYTPIQIPGYASDNKMTQDNLIPNFSLNKFVLKYIRPHDILFIHIFFFITEYGQDEI